MTNCAACGIILGCNVTQESGTMLKLLVITGLLLGAAPVAAQTQPPAPAISFDDQPAAATKEDSK